VLISGGAHIRSYTRLPRSRILAATQEGAGLVRSGNYPPYEVAHWCKQDTTTPSDLFAFSVLGCAATKNVFAISPAELWSLTGDFACREVP
jgi:hypothetical protein